MIWGGTDVIIIEIKCTINAMCLRACSVAQLCPTLCNPMESPGSSLHGIFPARVWNGLPFPPPRGISSPGSNPCLLHCSQILYHWATNDVLASSQNHPPPNTHPSPWKNYLPLNHPYCKERLETAALEHSLTLRKENCPFSITRQSVISRVWGAQGA